MVSTLLSFNDIFKSVALINDELPHWQNSLASANRPDPQPISRIISFSLSLCCSESFRCRVPK